MLAVGGRSSPPERQVRVRITQTLSGSIDGIQLTRFSKGQVYEVSASLGAYLLAIRAAEPAADDIPPVILPLDQQMFGPVAKGRGYKVRPVRDRAADRSDRGDEQ